LKKYKRKNEKIEFEIGKTAFEKSKKIFSSTCSLFF